jgi:predicted hydrocarbon binding protein
LYQQREIEAGIALPLIRTFIEKFGREAALEAVAETAAGLAFQKGEELAEALGGNGMEEFARVVEGMGAGNALEYEVLSVGPDHLHFDVRRCRFAEMYGEMGARDLGCVLSCGRDFALVRGFNPRMRLRRTRTIMEGDDRCDFRIKFAEDE